MGTLHRLPTRLPRSVPPPAGYCLECGVPVAWPSGARWPETCPNGCTPLVVTSVPVQPEELRVTNGAGELVAIVRP